MEIFSRFIERLTLKYEIFYDLCYVRYAVHSNSANYSTGSTLYSTTHRSVVAYPFLTSSIAVTSTYAMVPENSFFFSFSIVGIYVDIRERGMHACCGLDDDEGQKKAEQCACTQVLYCNL